MKNHIGRLRLGKGLSRHLVWTLVLVAGACSSGGGTNNTGSAGSAQTGHGGSSSGGSGGSGTAGTQGTAGGGGSGTAGATGGTGGSATGTGGAAGTTGGGGSAGTTGGSGGSAGSGGGAGGSAGANGGAGGRGGSGGAGGAAGTNGGAGGRGGAGGSAGANGGAGGRGGTGGAGGSAGSGNQDGGPSDAVVVHDGAVMSNGAYVRTGWTATYTCTGTCLAGNGDSPNDTPALAFDGNYQTRWSTDRFQQDFWNATPRQFPLYFTVDMKQVMDVSKVTMHPSCRDIFDAAGMIDVLVSTDGTNFTAVATNHKPAVPTNGETCPPSTTAVATDTVTFATTPARYVQIKATQSIVAAHPGSGDRYWAIGEMNVYP